MFCTPCDSAHLLLPASQLTASTLLKVSHEEVMASSTCSSTWGVISPRSGRWSDDEQDTLEFGPVLAFQLQGLSSTEQLGSVNEKSPREKLPADTPAMSWGYGHPQDQPRGSGFSQVPQLPVLASAPTWRSARPTVPTTPSRPHLPSGEKPCLGPFPCIAAYI